MTTSWNIITISLIVWLLGQSNYNDAMGNFIHELDPNEFQIGAVSSEHLTCSQIGSQLMKLGGSAVDAAIGALLCTGIINSFSAGIGGGGFMLIAPNTNQSGSLVIDYRETAPLGIRPEIFGSNTTLTVKGGLSVAVPSQIYGLYEAHQLYGKLAWSDIFNPNIELATRGFPITPKLAMMISRFSQDLQASEELRKIYFNFENSSISRQEQGSGSNVQGRWIPKGIGETVYQKELAETLKLVRDYGIRGFYTGPVAQKMVEAIDKAGGVLNHTDLVSYQVVQQPPLVASCLGFNITTANVPTSGPVLIQIMNILEVLNVDQYEDEVDRMHLFLEALKFGYGARMHLGDPAFAKQMDNVIAHIVNPKVAKIKASRIKLNQTLPIEEYLAMENINNDEFLDFNFSINCKELRGTTHISAIDADGLAVSVTDTINLEFGSRIMAGGVLLNNEMGDFSLDSAENPFGLPPSPNNFIEPGKRPMSSSTPVILTNATHRIVIGGAGGSRIISSTMQTLFNLVIMKRSPWSSIVLPRLHHQLCPNEIVAEANSDPTLLNKLQIRGHKVQVLPKSVYLSSVNMVVERTAPLPRKLTAISDPRKGGSSAGY